VEYTLTQQGLSLIELVKNIRDWSENNVAYILEAQTKYDARLATQN
jgi:DNA-binding HxlR family transcriptional regulator